MVRNATRILIGCSMLMAPCGCAPRWPADIFPEGVELERTLHAENAGIMREGCVAIVGEITDSSSVRVGEGRAIAAQGWRPTPLSLAPNEHLYAKAAFDGCGDGGSRPPGDLEGALERPGAYYKIVNGGEGLAVIVPRAKLAGWFYFG